MTGVPMTLDETLNLQGYTIQRAPADAFNITLPTGTLHVPAMSRAALHWERDSDPIDGDDLYLSTLPLFDDAYRPVLMSHILDRYRSRRLSYHTPGEWCTAFVRWGNLNMTVHNQRYLSTAVTLPLDDRNETDATTKDGTTGKTTENTTEGTRHTLDIESQFPQSLISASSAYASDASDNRSADNSTTTGTDAGTSHDTETVERTGRSQSVMRLLDEQRRLYINEDEAVMLELDSLFLGVFDQGEGNRRAQYGIPGSRIDTRDWPHYW